MNILDELEKRPFAFFIGLLIVSLMIKSVLIYQADIINRDGTYFIANARELFQGNIVASFYTNPMIGFSFVFGLVQLVVHDWFLAGKILSCLSLLLATIPLYFIANDLFGRKPAFFAALVFTIAPSVNERCTTIIRDPLFLLLFTLSLWLVLYAFRKSSYGFSLLAGLLCCLSVLVRSEGVVLFLCIMFFLTGCAIFISDNRHFYFKCLAAFCFLPFCGLIFIIVLVAIGEIPQEHVHVFFKKYLAYIQRDHLKIYMSIYSHLKGVEKSFPGGQFPNDFFEYARYNIYLVYLIGMIQTFVKDLFPLFVVPLIYGLNLKKQWNRKIVLFLMVLCSFLLMDYYYQIVRNFIASRYMFVTIVLSFILVGYGLDLMTAPTRSSRFRKVVVAILIMLCVTLPPYMVLRNSSSEKQEIKMAGVWLTEYRDKSATKMLLNDNRIAYHAGLFNGEYDLFNKKQLKQLDKLEQHEQLEQLEKIAFDKGRKIVVVYLDNQQVGNSQHFKEYALIKSFPGQKKTVMIYERKI